LFFPGGDAGDGSMIDPSERVAVVGIGGVFPGAADPEGFWANVAAGVDATREVPPGRWTLDPAVAYDPRVGAPDRVYATRGGFVEGFRLDPEGLDLDPALVARLDPMFHLALHAGRAAWRDASTDGLDRSRVGVVFGNIVLPTETASAIADETLGRTLEERVLGRSPGRPGATEPLNRFAAGLPAGLLAKALGLGGGTYTLDAACASSLYALKLAADELLAGRTDAMITGGLSRPDPLYTQMGFSQLRALSPDGRAYPFDARAGGLVVGEGAGMFVLKRLGDAIRQGDRVYGVVAAVGLSNDLDGGLLAPSSEGQLRAMRAAYERAGWDPRDVDLIECHATGTPVGDAVEFRSLKALWGESKGRGGVENEAGRCVIGSHKANIGHALTASGAAGLLKVLLALRHETLPPTANFAALGPQLGAEGGPFRVLTAAEPWPRRDGNRPRRAAVSGFGFGGINAHALIEEWMPEVSAQKSPDAWIDPEREAEPAAVAVVGLGAHFGPFRGLRAFQERVLGGGETVEPAPSNNDWGVRASAWLAREEIGPGAVPVNGYHLDALALRLARFRIPPRELEEMLPQQSLALLAAADAIADAAWDDRPRPRAGVFVGIGLDPNTTNFHVRWSVPDRARGWNESLALGLSGEALERWAAASRDAAGPPLTANRTMGALGGLIASRVAREFRVGGPSFTVSSEETSGLRAVEVAVRLLRQNEIDEAVVAAVDLTGDPRNTIAAARSGVHGLTRGDGAAGVVLKRLDDAVRDGDRVYAVIRGVGSATGPGIDAPAPDERAVLAARRRAVEEAGPGSDDGFHEAAVTERCAAARAWPLGSIQAEVGHTGAASGLAGLVKAALCLYQEILPPVGDVGPRYWLHDRADGPRRAAVSGSGVDGTCLHVVLEAYVGEPAPGVPVERVEPLGACPSALLAVEADDPSGLICGVEALDALAAGSHDTHVEALARRWWSDRPNDPARRLGLAVVADHAGELRERLAEARRRVERGAPSGPRDRVFYSPEPVGRGGRVALVFPGIGSQFAGMGRDLSARWPEVFRALDAETLRLRSQLAPGAGWDDAVAPAFEDQRAPIMAQVVLGTAVADLLRSFGVTPGAVIGYSLGESSALFATRAWAVRDEIHARLDASPLFRTELAGPCEAARRAWRLAPGEPADWVAGVVPYPAEAVRAAVQAIPRAYLLIVNTPRECVVGGHRPAVERLAKALGGRFLPLPMVSTVHCEIARGVESAYRELHLLPTTPPRDVRFYSAARGRAYEPDRASAAEAIVGLALDTVDFAAVVRRAYDDGVRAFIEVGPGGSCSRMIRATLGHLPHLARPACVAGSDAVATVLDLLGRLIADRVAVDLSALYGRATRACALTPTPEIPTARTVNVPVGGHPFQVPEPPRPAPTPTPTPFRDDHEARPTVTEHPVPHRTSPALAVAPGLDADDPLARQVLVTESSRGEAHEAYLRVSGGLAQTMANHLAFQMALVEALMSSPASAPASEAAPTASRPALDRSQCLEFAVGSIGKVLGPAFDAVDAHPTRVRLPGEPLMLVDRVLTIEGEPRSLSSGRVVTEHDILPGDWYLDHGKIPACIAVESGQADLFLSGYLGIDFETKGLAVYRLLDAVVTFYRGMPGPGEVIRYEITISEFFRQGDTHLFRFRFDATVGGEPLMTMRDGCAGFFTAEALAAGRGVVRRPLDLRPSPVARPGDWVPPVPLAVESYDDRQVEALRRGDYAAAFGHSFAGLGLDDPLRLPGGRMTLLHRVTRLDPQGGRFGLGLIQSELDIRPDDWFLTCHFVDDRVMPGTLMYECCLHTLRVFLMRLGWVAESAGVAFEPVPGVPSRLRCRGQVVETTARAVFELTVKEIGFRPEPYAVADALMYADGKPIVEVTDMTLRLTGLTRESLLRVWELRAGAGMADDRWPMADPDQPPHPAQDPSAPGPQPSAIDRQSSAIGHSESPFTGTSPVLFAREQVLAFALGKPSEAFGDRYRPFDKGRVIARLPAPPYSFLDRVIRIEAEPWVLAEGASAVAEYDVPPDAWYFAANRQERMPFAVLLEVPLQVCGWLAAYCGSALTSDEDLAFRNLGGTGVRLADVTPATGTLTSRVTMTKVARSGGMIIQHFDLETRAGATPVYRGMTYFGFFRREALAHQVGVREAVVYRPTPVEIARAQGFDYPAGAPFPDDRLRMIGRVSAFVPDGGPAGLGFIEGETPVDPSAWFFKAHFHQDPVCPGSLGLESLLQLLKVVGFDRWGAGAGFEPVGLGDEHRWAYRGQVVPGDRLVTTQAVVTGIDDAGRRVKADGFLSVDGRVIYQMHDFTLKLVETR
jgi:acyl transferase domain-containing protein/3-hydroxymyristoyl/3-hydroxydecanoyl-(acyl carrier protein) dehydratase